METEKEITREQLNHVREILLKEGYEVDFWLESDGYGKKAYHKIKPIPLKIDIHSSKIESYANGESATRLIFAFDINKPMKLNESDLNKLGVVLCDYLKENMNNI